MYLRFCRSSLQHIYAHSHVHPHAISSNCNHFSYVLLVICWLYYAPSIKTVSWQNIVVAAALSLLQSFSIVNNTVITTTFYRVNYRILRNTNFEKHIFWFFCNFVCLIDCEDAHRWVEMIWDDIGHSNSWRFMTSSRRLCITMKNTEGQH